jgi:hypothetical protein
MDCYGSAAVGRSGARHYLHSLQRLAPPVLGAAFVLCCLASVKAAIGPATATLDQVLKTDSTDLARGYLLVDSELLAAKVAGIGLAVHTTVDGKPQTIDKSNYQTFVSGYEERLRIYAQAISQRGFSRSAAPTTWPSVGPVRSMPGWKMAQRSSNKTVFSFNGRQASIKARSHFRALSLNPG